MNIFEDTNPRKLSELLTLIHSKDMALPDFQRSFVWDPSATQELVISIASNYPAGSLLRVRNAGDLFAVREFEGAPVLDGNKPSFLILDGQQRLTSLYQAFYGKGEHRFFVDLGLLLKGKDFEECIFHMRSSRADRKHGPIDKQAKNLILPLEIVYGSNGGFFRWMDEVLEIRDLDKEETSVLRKQLRELHGKWIEPIEHYEFPVVTLSTRTNADAVCTIFETLNRTGVKLSVFELLTARFWPKDVNLRALFDDAKKQYSNIDDFEIDPYYILQIVSLLNPHKAPSCKRSDLLLGLTPELIKENWQPVVKALDEILKIIAEDCGVLIPQWLPYNTILIPMVGVWAKQKAAKGVQIGANRKKIVQWYWCSVLTQAYENAPNSQAAKDFTELNKWIEGGEEPETIRTFSFDIDQLRETSPRQRAVYRAIICLVLRNGSIDFYEGKRITADLLKDKKIDDHHIFPDAYLESKGVPKIQRDCVINRTLIDRKTNQSIGKRPPADYLKDIEKKIGRDVLEKVIKSHLIAENTQSLKQHSFEEFIEHRLNLLKQHIQEATGKNIKDPDGNFEKK
jgi:hypothetical protein